MKVEAKCKFCHRPITLTIDDLYAATRDHLGLIPLACCNFCGDFYTERRLLFEKIRKNALMLLSGVVKKDDKPKSHEILSALMKRYMRLLADFKGVPVPDWDEQIVDHIMQSPGNYSEVLSRIPMMLSQPTLL